MSNENDALGGKRILVTSPDKQGERLSELIKQKGGFPFLMPAIEINLKPLEPEELADVKPFSKFEWLVFTSANGVKGFCQNFGTLDQALKDPDQPKIAVVGDKTQKGVADYKAEADFIPEETNARKLGETLPAKPSDKVLWPTGNVAKPDLREGLEKRHVEVKTLTVYETHKRVIPKDSLETVLNKGVNAILFTSPSGIEGFFENLERHNLKTGDAIFGCIGESTAHALKKQGRIPNVIPEHKSIEGLLAGLANHLNKSKAKNEI